MAAAFDDGIDRFKAAIRDLLSQQAEATAQNRPPALAGPSQIGP
jgi:hypothetical protein